MAFKNKEVAQKYYREYYQRNKEKKAIQKRKKYLENREVILKRLRDKYIPHPRILKTEEEKKKAYQVWRETHRDEYNTYMREWTRKQRDRLNPLRMKRYNDDSKFRDRFYRLNIAAKSRNYLVSISLEEFSELVIKPCVYCGETEKRRGIDRIDNNKGYTKENSVSCCKVCNIMKRTYTKEQFFEHIIKIVKYNSLLLG